ncbi:hypothetical protein CHUAL_006826 [Chamberlinius hualienensis]
MADKSDISGKYLSRYEKKFDRSFPAMKNKLSRTAIGRDDKGFELFVGKCLEFQKDDGKRKGKLTVLSDPILLRLNRDVAVAKLNTSLPINVKLCISHTICASKTPLNQLKRVGIRDLKLEVSATGCYVILRVLDQGFTVIGWSTSVEDHENAVCGFCVYNYPSNELFAIGTVLIVKEPYFKIVASGDPYIRCDCPTDIVVLRESHPLHYMVDNINWIHDLADEENSAIKSSNSKLPEDWLDRGNSLSIKLDFVSAREAYLLGLKMCEEKNDTWKKLKLYAAEIFLKLGYFESAISACAEVMVECPEEKNALFITGKAHYNLRQYSDAYLYFDQFCHLFPFLDEGKSELKNCLARLEEQKGNVNIAQLAKQCLADPTKKLECADYIGPIEIVDIPGKGRGIVLTEDVEKNTLLMVSKAVAAILTSKKSTIEIFTDDRINLTSEIASEIAEMLMKNPNTYGPIIYDLSTGAKQRKEVQAFCDPNTKTEPICDVGILKDICRCNVCGIRGYENREIGVFIFPSYMNHSCIPNVLVKCLNDVMLIYSAIKLKIGEEIVISYIPLGLNDDERRQRLLNRGFICQCISCTRRGTRV